MHHESRPLLDCLFGEYYRDHQGYIELRLIKPHTNPIVHFFPNLESLYQQRIFEQLHSKNNEGYNIFFGVTPRKIESGDEEAVAGITAVWADIDYEKKKISEEAALESIRSLKHLPSIIVRSGHGFHLYWLLDRLYVQHTERELTRSIMNGLAKILKGDHVSDLPRLLRLPGSNNVKDVNNPKKCEIEDEHFHPEQRYSLQELEEYAISSIPSQEPTNPNDHDLDTRLNRFLAKDWRLRKTWEGKRDMPQDNSRSGYDMAVADLLAQDGFTEEEIVTILPKNPSGKGIEATESYLKHTAQKAVAEHGSGRRSTNPQQEAKPSSRASHPSLLMQYLSEEDTQIFVTDKKRGFARINVNSHYEIHPIASETFKSWLARLFWTRAQTVISQESIKSVLTTLEGKAHFESGSPRRLHNRVCEHDGAFWLDLTNANWQAIKIQPGSWEISDNPPPLFQRYAHQKPQVTPLHGGDPWKLMRYLGIGDDRTRLLVLAAIITSFIPDIPHPIIRIQGRHGGGKTTASRIIRRIIDPSIAPILSAPTDTKELVQALDHNYFSILDNLSEISRTLSDALCRAVTGEGFTKRKNYSDDDDFIYSYRRCLIINGIGLHVRPDLMDRSISLFFEGMKRKDEGAFWKGFEEDLPSILGGCLDVLAKAMELKPSLKVDNLPRMADFALWGTAISKALGKRQSTFIRAYESQIHAQEEEILSSEPVADMVKLVMEGKESWEGTASQFIKEVKDRDSTQSLAQNRIKAPQLTRRIFELAPNLELLKFKLKRNKRGFTITRTAPPYKTLPIQRTGDDIDSKDGSPSFKGKEEEGQDKKSHIQESSDVSSSPSSLLSPPVECETVELVTTSAGTTVVELRPIQKPVIDSTP